MTRTMRKYQKWLIVGFGVLLMLAFLAPQAIQELGQMRQSRVVAKVDGSPVRAVDMQNAAREVTGFSDLGRRIPFFNPGVEDRDTAHWLLLTREAELAGFVGEGENGAAFLEQYAPLLARQAINSDQQLMIQFYMERDPQRQQAMLQQLADQITNLVYGTLSGTGLNGREIEKALARFVGVRQMQFAYFSSPRVSSRAAVHQGKRNLDAAVGDFLFVPALKIAGDVPPPDAQTLEAHFERFRTIRPGEGEYGIGYLLPARVKLEYLALNRDGIRQAVTLDPVEVRKIHAQSRAQYPGEFASERERIEAKLRSDKGDQVMREAHSVLQREVLKVTRRLESRSGFRTLPPDWEEHRPRLADIAPVIVEQVRASTGVTIPQPQVMTLTDSWFTQQELSRLPGIGMSAMRQGSLTASFPEVAFFVRELGGAGFVPVQTGVPFVDNYLEDQQGNRYFFSVVATRPESAPDSVAELGEQAVDDYRRVVAFEQAKERLDELASAAAGEGLQSLAERLQIQPVEPGAATQGVVRSGVRVSRARADVAEPALTDEKVRDRIMTAASNIDPLASPEQIQAEVATVVAAAPRQLGLVVFRVQRVDPLTREMVREQGVDDQLIGQIVNEELRDRAREAFSLGALLRRHNYTVGDRRLTSPDELRRSDDQEG